MNDGGQAARHVAYPYDRPRALHRVPSADSFLFKPTCIQLVMRRIRCSRPDASVESISMSRKNRQGLLGRSILTIVVISIIAFLLLLSVAITSGTGHGFDQIALALPIFFVVLLLATPVGDWLELEDFFIEAEPRLSTVCPRAPPA